MDNQQQTKKQQYVVLNMEVALDVPEGAKLDGSHIVLPNGRRLVPILAFESENPEEKEAIWRSADMEKLGITDLEYDELTAEGVHEYEYDIQELHEVPAPTKEPEEFVVTTVTVEVLGKTQVEFDTLEDLHRETVHGSFSANWDVETRNVSRREMARLCEAQGTDPAFSLGDEVA